MRIYKKAIYPKTKCLIWKYLIKKRYFKLEPVIAVGAKKHDSFAFTICIKLRNPKLGLFCYFLLRKNLIQVSYWK